MKALIMVEINPFLSPDEPEPKPENYTYSLSVMNEVGIPVLFREKRDLIPMPEKKPDRAYWHDDEFSEGYRDGWNACLEEIEKNVRKAEHD